MKISRRHRTGDGSMLVDWHSIATDLDLKRLVFVWFGLDGNVVRLRVIKRADEIRLCIAACNE